MVRNTTRMADSFRRFIENELINGTGAGTACEGIITDSTNTKVTNQQKIAVLYT